MEAEQVNSSELSFQDYKLMRAGKLEPKAEEPKEAAEVEEEPIEQAEEEEPEVAASPEESEDPKPKGKGGFQRRIDKLTAKNSRLESENSELANRIAEIERKLSGQSTTVQEKADDSKPDPQKFATEGKTYEDYVEALAKWTVKQEREAQKREESEREAQERTQTIVDSYAQQIAEAKSKHDDWDDVLSGANIMIPTAASLAIQDSDNGAEIAYYLAKHPDECEKLMGLPSDVRVVAYIGSLSARLSPSEKPEGKKVSSAPKPPSKVSGGTAVSGKSVEDMSFQEYKAYRKKN